jgi:hypothetical protein
MTTSSASLIIFALVLAFAADVFGATFQFQVTPENILPGNRARLEIRLTPTAEELRLHKDVSPEVRDELLTASEKHILLDHGGHRDKETWVWTYEITQYQPGFLSFPPIEVRWGPETFSTETRKIQVLGNRTPGDEELRSEFGSLPIPVRLGYLLKWLILSVGFALAVRYGLKRIPRSWFRRKIPRKPPPPVSDESAADWLRRQLALLRNEANDPDASDLLVDELSLVLRTYYERATKKPTRRWTTRELQRNLPSEIFDKTVLGVFQNCDHFRFSGKKPGSLTDFLFTNLDAAERSLLPC